MPRGQGGQRRPSLSGSHMPSPDPTRTTGPIGTLAVVCDTQSTDS